MAADLCEDLPLTPLPVDHTAYASRRYVRATNDHPDAQRDRCPM